MSSTEQKLSPVELHKSESNYLRGTVKQDLAGDAGSFGKADISVLKFHGTYQQDDRDARKAAKGAGGAKPGKSYSFMVRTKIPGGRLTTEQMLAELDLCDELGTATLRATSRQGLQLHGIIKDNLKAVIRRINEIQLSTLAACGDVERNVMCCPAPWKQNPVHDKLQQFAESFAVHFCPRTTAYHELWLTDEETGESFLEDGGPTQEIEPIYGPTYLPRKFKTAFAPAYDNCVDILTHDLGFLAQVEGGKILGFNVLVGGGFGVTPSDADTFPALGKQIAYISPDQVIAAGEAVIKVFRDFGNRADRKRARIKYLVHDWGVPAFKAKMEEYMGSKLADPAPFDVTGFDDHLGWHEQGDGKLFYGLNIENGRIKDEGDFRLKAALRMLCREIPMTLRLTAHQSILFCDVQAPFREVLEQILREHGVPLSEDISTVRRWSMACVAWPTCGLAITESERALPGMIDDLEPTLAKLGLSNEKFTIRMTGCPNGCARPYNSDIGLVGRAQGKYTIFVGGRLLGDRLNTLYKDHVPAENVVGELAKIFAAFKQYRTAGESLGDFCTRLGPTALAEEAEKTGF